MASKRRQLANPYDELRRRAGIKSTNIPVRIVPGFLAPSYVRETIKLYGRNHVKPGTKPEVLVGYDWLSDKAPHILTNILFPTSKEQS